MASPHASLGGNLPKAVQHSFRRSHAPLPSLGRSFAATLVTTSSLSHFFSARRLRLPRSRQCSAPNAEPDDDITRWGINKGGRGVSVRVCNKVKNCAAEGALPAPRGATLGRMWR